MVLVRSLFLGLTLLVLGSCSLFQAVDQEQWVHEIVENGPPIRDMLSECEWAMLDAGFSAGDRDDSGARVTSAWRENLQPFSSMGRRYQGILEIESMGEVGLYRINARVRVQRNKEVHQPLDSGEADWESMDDSTVHAQTLLRHFMGRVTDPSESIRPGGRQPWTESETDRGE